MPTSGSRTEWTLCRLLTDVVGSGPNSATDMTKEQATAAMTRILRTDPDPTTLGAFLLANRWKRNTPEELAAFVDVMREHSVRVAEPVVSPVDCGANYDGKTETAVLGVAAGIVAAAAGTTVVTHSADRIPATRGVVYRHVLDELGIAPVLDPAESAAMVDATGFGFYYQPSYNPGIHALLGRREALGVRSFLNTIETLANPANASVHLGSFFHRSFPEKIIETIRASQSLAMDRIVMVRGLEGYDDARPDRTLVIEWRDDTVQEFTVNSDALGLSVELSDLYVPDVAVDSARLTEDVVIHNQTGSITDAVLLNAGLRIYAGGDVGSIEAGIEQARNALDSGQAEQVLSKLRSFDPKAPTDVSAV